MSDKTQERFTGFFSNCAVRRGFTLLVLAAVVGCGGSDGQPNDGDANPPPTDGGGGIAGKPSDASTPTDAGGGKAGLGLFADDKIPNCSQGFETQYQVRGSIGTDALTINGTIISYFVKNLYQHQSVANGSVKIDLSFTWAETLDFDRAVPLTGEFLVVPSGHPLAGRKICVTEGSFGVRKAPGGIQVLYAIKGARDGSCTDASLPIDLRACVFRKDTALP